MGVLPCSTMSGELFVTSLHRDHLLHSWNVKLDSERTAFAECIALKPNGNLVISDLLNKKVKEFEKTGKLVACIGDKEGQALRSPRGVAVLSGNRTAVADPQANCIKIFDKSGKLTSKIKGPHIDLPCDLMIGTKKGVYISVDEGKGMICLKSEVSDDVRTVDMEVNMQRPGCMVLTSSGSSIVVCDELSSCMYVLDERTLALQQTITLTGNDVLDAGNKCTPAGACVDEFGFLYITDTNNNRILVFDEDMEVRAILHTADWFKEIRMRKDVEEMRLTLSGPVGVVVNKDGELCVLEQAGRVKVFKHFQQIPEKSKKQKQTSNKANNKKSSSCIIL